VRQAHLVALAVLGMGPALLHGATARSQGGAKAPRIAVEPDGFDFGQSLKNKELVKEFYVRNHGGTDLVIEKVTTSCGCTAALLNERDRVVKPGGSASLQVKLRTSVPGRLVKSVLIKSNDPARELYELKVQADVVEATP
jgi:hypothetical protein